MRILAILLFCSSLNAQESADLEGYTLEEEPGPGTEQYLSGAYQYMLELYIESNLFNDLFSLTQNLNQFVGNAFLGSLDGTCYMVLKSNSQDYQKYLSDGGTKIYAGAMRRRGGYKIAQLRYQINNYLQATSIKADETYTITELKRKSAKKESGYGFGLNNTRDYEDTYLYGSVKGLKASIDNGAIIDGSGRGNIWFVLDSVDYELTYVIELNSKAKAAFSGSVRLNTGQYIKFKELFGNRELSKKEIEELADLLINLRNRWDADGDATDWLERGSRVYH